VRYFVVGIIAVACVVLFQIGCYHSKHRPIDVYLTVESEYGSPVPPVGSNYLNYGMTITASVDSPVEGPTGTRYLCTGWSGTGSVPATGTTNSCQFVIKQNSTITWTWVTQYELTTNILPPGSGTVTRLPDGNWYDADTSVELTAIANAGCTFTEWSGDLTGTTNPQNLSMDGPKSVTANFLASPPVAGFSATPTYGIAPLTVQFTNESTGAITSYAWDFDNNGITDSAVQNPSCTYTGAGAYTVRLTVTGPGGSDEEIKLNYISVSPPPAPVASFTGTPTSGNAPLTVQFTDTSINNPTSWAWDFDNNGTTDSTVRNPSYTYNNPGAYTVKLTVTNAGGSDSEVKSGYIMVSSAPLAPVASFTGTPTSGDAPLTVQFTDASTGLITTWAWDFNNDGTTDSNVQNPSHTYGDGTYTVKLTVTGPSGSDDEIKTDYITAGMPPRYGWTYRMGSSSSERGYAICADASGNVYLTGSFSGGTVNFAADWGRSDPKTSAGSADIFITKIDVNGNYLWTRRMGGASNDYGYAICADASGNIYLTGNFSGSSVNFAADWGGSDLKTSAGSTDIFITKVDVNGNYCWTRRMGGTDGDEAYGVCADVSGNIYLAGSFYSATVNFAQDWGGSDTKTNAGNYDIFITKMDVNGNYCWTRRIGSGGGEQCYDICADAGGNVYLTGDFYSTVNFAADWGGSDTKTGDGWHDPFVTKIDVDGNYCWTWTMGSNNHDYGKAICADGSGNIYLTGCVDTYPGYDIFITKIDVSGDYYWTRRMGRGLSEGTDNRGYGICVDASGNIYLTGRFSGGKVNFAAAWGGIDLKTSAGSADIFITKIDVNGNYRWTRRMGGASDDYGYAICADASGNIYLTGSFSGGTVNFAQDWGGSDTKTTAGSADIFITKIAP